MKMEYRCVVCGAWFDSKLVKHDSAWWNKRRHDQFCSEVCIGKLEMEERMSNARNRPVAEVATSDDDVSKTLDSNIPIDFGIKILELVAIGKIDATDAKIISALMETPRPSQRDIAVRLGVSQQAISKRVVEYKSLFIAIL
jgi:hypothetical protein